MVFDVFQGESPAAGNGTQSSSDAAPSSKMSPAAMVGNMAGLMRWNCPFASLAFGLDVMKVQISRTYATTTEVAIHKQSFLCVDLRFCKNRFQNRRFIEPQKEGKFVV